MGKLFFKPEQREITQEEARALADCLQDVAASLDNALLHLGEHMTPQDAKQRRENVSRAELILKGIGWTD